MKEVGNIIKHIENHDIAFVLGNGINRMAYNESNIDCSWSNLLSVLFHQIITTEQDNLNGVFKSKDITPIEKYAILSNRIGTRELKEKVTVAIAEWKQTERHIQLYQKFSDYDVPVLTTNFDSNLDSIPQNHRVKDWPRKMPINKKLFEGHNYREDNVRFSATYPFNQYCSHKVLQNANEGFAVWHIHGTIQHPQSIRLGIDEYAGLIHKVKQYSEIYHTSEDFEKEWPYNNTWLLPFYTKPLCIVGLNLGKDEILLRYMLIERDKFLRYHKGDALGITGWYLYPKGEKRLRGTILFLKALGVKPVAFDSIHDIYETLFGIR